MRPIFSVFGNERRSPRTRIDRKATKRLDPVAEPRGDVPVVDPEEPAHLRVRRARPVAKVVEKRHVQTGAETAADLFELREITPPGQVVGCARQPGDLCRDRLLERARLPVPDPLHPVVGVGTVGGVTKDGDQAGLRDDGSHPVESHRFGQIRGRRLADCGLSGVVLEAGQYCSGRGPTSGQRSGFPYAA